MAPTNVVDQLHVYGESERCILYNCVSISLKRLAQAIAITLDQDVDFFLITYYLCVGNKLYIFMEQSGNQTTHIYIRYVTYVLL